MQHFKTYGIKVKSGTGPWTANPVLHHFGRRPGQRNYWKRQLFHYARVQHIAGTPDKPRYSHAIKMAAERSMIRNRTGSAARQVHSIKGSHWMNMETGQPMRKGFKASKFRSTVGPLNGKYPRGMNRRRARMLRVSRVPRRGYTFGPPRSWSESKHKRDRKGRFA